jgi:hypothetical protein
MVKKLGMALGALACVALAAGTAGAQNKCTAAKLKSAGKTGGGTLKCNSKADGKGLADADITTCEAKPEAALVSGFTKADAKVMGGCPGTASTVQTDIDNCESATNTAVGNAGSPRVASKCDGKIVAAMGKKLSGLLSCDSKEAAKNVDQSACRTAVSGKFSTAMGKLATATDCSLGHAPTAGDITTLEGVIDTCRTNIKAAVPAACAAIVPGQQIANTYHTTDIVGPGVCILGSAANELGTCQSDADCGGTGGACIPTPWISAGGITLPFPLGINLAYTVTSEDPAPSCSHPACLGCGNAAALCSGMTGCGGNPPTNPKCVSSTCCDQPALTVPTFYLSALGTCVKVDQKTCGLGVVNSSNPQTGDNEVSKTGDTSDPGADCTYGTGDDPPVKPCDVTVAGAGSDKKGKVVRTLGNGMPDTAGVHSRFAVPIMATAWTDKPPQTPGAACPGNDTFDVGEILLTQLILNAELSTAGATGSFADLNGDGCSFAGSAFGGGNVGPIVLAPPTVHPAPYAGGANLMASVGLVFPGTGPLNDLGFIALVPFAQPTVAPPQSCSCTLTPGCPE